MAGKTTTREVVIQILMRKVRISPTPPACGYAGGGIKDGHEHFVFLSSHVLEPHSDGTGLRWHRRLSRGIHKD